MKKHKIVILGGGYAGIAAIRYLTYRKDMDIHLIDKHSYHSMQPELYDYVANKMDAADMTIDLITLTEQLGENITFHNRRVIDIDTEKKILYTVENDDFTYDYLILGVGARTRFPKQIKGLDNTLDIKKLHRALNFKQSFEQEMFNKIDQEGRKCEELSVVVVGAGLSGVELAAEMAYYSQVFFYKGAFACQYMKIHLISSYDTVLPGSDPFMIQESQKRLDKLKVHTVRGRFMTEADDEFVHLDDGTKIRYSFVIFTGGIEAANIINKIDTEKNRIFQMITDDYLRVNGHKDIFAAGDCIEAKDKNGNWLPPTVQVALQTGEYAAKNLCHTLDGKPLEKYECYSPGTLVALGGKYAAGVLFGYIKINGWFAHAFKQLVFWKYKKPLQVLSRLGYKKLYKVSSFWDDLELLYHK